MRGGCCPTTVWLSRKIKISIHLRSRCTNKLDAE
jgi:hypothetical protein